MVPAETLDPLQVPLGLALALAVGAALGLERERHAQAERKSSFGGARTFPVVALFGALLALIGRDQGPAPVLTGLVVLASLLAVGHWKAQRADGSPQLGLTSELAALVTYLLGALPFVELAALSFAQRLLLAGAVATALMAILALHRPIHQFAEQLSSEDLQATVRFALAALVALPLLPDEGYGPSGVLNPFRIGIVVVLIAGLSFVGYVAARLFGPRKGLAVTAAAGGLVSSTAVTLAFAARARENPTLRSACALAVCLAATIMFARVIVLIAAVRPPLAAAVALPLGTMLAVATLGSLVFWRSRTGDVDGESSAKFSNPFRLREALRLGVVYAIVRLVSVLAWEHFGDSGLYASAFLSGLADVDAITLSVTQMQGQGLERELAVHAITIAAATNTLVKVGLCAVLGGQALARSVGLVLVPATVAGVAVAWIA